MTKRYCINDHRYGVIKYVTRINEPKDEIQDDSITEEKPDVLFKKIKTEPPKNSSLKYRVKQEQNENTKKDSRSKSPKSVSNKSVVIVIDDDEPPTTVSRKRSLTIKRE